MRHSREAILSLVFQACSNRNVFRKPCQAFESTSPNRPVFHDRPMRDNDAQHSSRLWQLTMLRPTAFPKSDFSSEPLDRRGYQQERLQYRLNPASLFARRFFVLHWRNFHRFRFRRHDHRLNFLAAFLLAILRDAFHYHRRRCCRLAQR